MKNAIGVSKGYARDARPILGPCFFFNFMQFMRNTISHLFTSDISMKRMKMMKTTKFEMCRFTMIQMNQIHESNTTEKLIAERIYVTFLTD